MNTSAETGGSGRQSAYSCNAMVLVWLWHRCALCKLFPFLR